MQSLEEAQWCNVCISFVLELNSSGPHNLGSCFLLYEKNSTLETNPKVRVCPNVLSCCFSGLRSLELEFDIVSGKNIWEKEIQSFYLSLQFIIFLNYIIFVLFLKQCSFLSGILFSVCISLKSVIYSTFNWVRRLRENYVHVLTMEYVLWIH